MADVITPLLNGVSPSATGTFYSTYFDTKDYRDFAFVLRMPSTGNTGAGSVVIYIECSSESAFTNAYKIRTLTLTSPTGTQQTVFNTVANNTTLPADTNTVTTLRQFWNANDKNVDRYLRVRYVVTGTAADYTNITVDLLANRRV
jgi:hypothetical protein